jgi:hypothetical protein
MKCFIVYLLLRKGSSTKLAFLTVVTILNANYHKRREPKIDVAPDLIFG